MPVMLTGKPASSMNPDTWADYKQVKRSRVGDGLGFVLGDGIGCIDLDHCLVDGKVTPEVADLLESLPSTYIEISPSGDGLHVFGFLKEGPGRGQHGGDGIEVYSTGRYMTVTGNRWIRSSGRLGDLNTFAESVCI